MRLCAPCQACVAGTAKRLELSYLQHHESRSSWVAALDTGCMLCSEMRQHLEHKNKEADTAKLDAAMVEHTIAAVYYSKLKQALSFYHPDKDSEAGTRNVIASFAFVPRIGAAPEEEKQYDTTGSQGTMGQAKSWLHSCKMHNLCSGEGLSTWLPLRLIDLRPLDPSIDFRIIDTSITKVSGRYASLSHCWGKNPDILTLNAKTQGDLYHGLRLEVLPRTFRDAFHVCRSLGTPFLWIDSLCILQDSRQDWEEQSQQMCHVYQEAEYNISADASLNGHGGLFRDYRGHFRAQHTVNSHERGEGRRISNGDYDVVNTYAWTQDISLSPLNLRAWVFQERHLARRILHFSRHQVFWECNTKIASQVFPRGIPFEAFYESETKKYGRVLSTQIDPKATAERCNAGQKCEICEQWEVLLVAFSRTFLTYRDDRPYAIDGLGQAFSALAHDTYIFGLCRGHIKRQLNWHTRFISPSDAESYFSNGRAPTREIPSYSWLSLDCRMAERVSLDGGNTIQFCYDIEAVHDKSILVSCSLVRVFLTLAQDGYSWNAKRPSPASSFCEIPITSPDWGRFNLPSTSTGKEHFLMPTMHTKSEVVGLMLERTHREEAVFRRIGYWSGWESEDCLERNDQRNMYELLVLDDAALLFSNVITLI